ncbi:GntR family transcriptional regulator [Rhizobium sp. KVB221]|uniref:GntR family transcriptional regulator n=1 Tax=Rhizobium setariae TaxID=2801340 RepID=A0A937CR50_9HYPH|nr:GntR family transcriptional regulator [Rhizobium setariae]MBL0373927.1 GntR family transcriptional regulator [Rhizobium setariae]
MRATPESQSRLAYFELEKLIVTSKLAPGSVVTEKQLIALAGYGRTPVREAIQKLEWQGLMQVRPRAGLQITPLNPTQQAMVLEARRQLEPLATRLMAGNISPTYRKRLIDCAKTMTECSITGDSEGYLAADRHFDEIVEATCPNPFITQALATLQTHSRRFWFHSATRQLLELSVDLHVRVIRALLNGDAAQAEKTMAALVDGLIDYAGTTSVIGKERLQGG